MSFEVGDRVVSTRESYDAVPPGSIGTVRSLPHDGAVYVVFDRIDGDEYTAESGWTMFPWQLQKVSGTADRQRVYVSGPMTGYEDYNFPAFNAAAEELRGLGYEVENPADKGIVDGWEWRDYMRYDVAKLSECDAIYTLPGWRKSKGANVEMYLAKTLGIDWLNPDEEGDSFPEGDVIGVPAGEVRVTSSTGGQKGSKPERFDLIPWDGMQSVARVYAFGAQKYDDDNWRKGYDWRLSIAAAFRHMTDFVMGEDYDPESGEPHPAHAIFHMLLLIVFLQNPERYGAFDSRTKVKG